MSDRRADDPRAGRASASEPTASSPTSTRSTTSTSPARRRRLDVEQVYERYEELTRLETAQRHGGRADRAVAVRVRGLPRQPDARAPGARSRSEEAALEATVDGETIPYRMLRVAMSNEPDRDKRQRARGDARAAARRAPEPGLPRRGADRPRGGARSSARRTTTSSTSASASASTSSPPSAATLLDETEKLWEREGDRLFRSRLGIGLDDARPWDVARLFRAPELDQLYPPDRMLPALERDAHRPRHRPALAGRTSTSTSRARPRKSPRAVLRADRGARHA